LIDHGAALGFQYGLPVIDASAARRPYSLREPHVLKSRVDDLASEDLRFAALITRQVIERAVAEVPDELLVPLLTTDSLGDRRAAYRDYLMRRLDAPRPFLEPVVVPGSQRPLKGRPVWLDRGR
jgi:predicted DNA-binding protein